jgi:hypothetical protein
MLQRDMLYACHLIWVRPEHHAEALGTSPKSGRTGATSGLQEGRKTPESGQLAEGYSRYSCPQPPARRRRQWAGGQHTALGVLAMSRVINDKVEEREC